MSDCSAAEWRGSSVSMTGRHVNVTDTLSTPIETVADATPESIDGPGTAAPQSTETSPGEAQAAATVDPQARARELAILDALRAVVDPEIGMNVVELALIRQIVLGPDQTEVRMILTTPFCPYAGSMVQQVKEQTETVVDHEVKVTLLAERWDPRDAGLVW